MRVGILTNLLAPYRIPLFEAIANRPGLNVRVFTTSESQRNRDWETRGGERAFDHDVLAGYSPYSYRLDRAVGVNPSVVPALRRYDPDVLVIGGYSDVTMWIGLAVARATGIPVVPWVGTWKGSNRTSNRVSNALKRRFVTAGDAWLAYGTRAREFLTDFGADADRVYRAINTVDLEWFRRRAANVSPPSGDSFHLLYCGQLIPRKNVDTVIDALSRGVDAPTELTILGDGPQRDELEAAATQLDTPVQFEGHVDRRNVPTYYGAADALILPSQREVWGLVVNEALACGTPVLVSDNCGCVPDLIDSGFNGQRFDPAEVDSVKDALTWALEQKEALRRRRDEIASDIVDRASLSDSAAAFVAAIDEASEGAG